MTLVEQGINSFRDAIHNKIKDGALGYDGTAVTTGDTALGDPISSTTYTLNKTKANKSIKLNYATTIGDGTGFAAREFVVTDTDDKVILRSVFPGIELTSTTVLSISTQVLFIQDY